MIKYYPFELHTHTYHSDGSMSPVKLIDSALERGLKGIALTDHNTVSSVSEAIEYGKEKGITVIPGIEWTTFYGHLTVLGGNVDISWRSIDKANINEMIKSAVSSGALVNAAHPKRPGSPICTGCYMEYDLDWANITGYEVWSNPKPYLNAANLNAYDEYIKLIKAGHKLACLYGDDWHDIRSNSKQYAITYLGVEGELNSLSALSAIRNRRTYISLGTLIDVKLIDGAKEYVPGDIVKAGEYSLEISVGVVEEYATRFNLKPENILLTRSGGSIEIIPITSEKMTIDNLILREGYLLIEADGIIDNNNVKLLICSPYYVEDI